MDLSADVAEPVPGPEPGPGPGPVSVSNTVSEPESGPRLGSATPYPININASVNLNFDVDQAEQDMERRQEQALDAAERLLARKRYDEARAMVMEVLFGILPGADGVQQEELQVQVHGLGRARALLVRLHLAHQEFVAALELAEETLVQVRARGDRASEAHISVAVADVYRGLDRPKEALRVLQLALQTFQSLQDDAGEASALQRMGSINLEMASFVSLKRGLDLADRALAKANEGEVVTTLLILAKLHRARQNHALAVELAGEAVSLAGSGGHLREYSEALRVSAATLMTWTQAQEEDSPPTGLHRALELAKEAITASRSAQDLDSEVSSLHVVKDVYQRLGMRTEALGSLEVALQQAKELNDPRLIDGALTALAQIYVTGRQPEKVQQVFQEELERAKETASAQRKLMAFRRLVALLLELQRTDEALERAQEAQATLEPAGIKQITAAALQLQAEVLQARQSYDEAIVAAMAAHALAQEAQDVRLEVELLQLVSNMQVELGNDEEALRLLEVKRLTYKEAGWRDEEATALLSLAELLLSAAGPRVAVQKAREALALCEQMQDTDGAATAQLALARFQLLDGKSTEALHSCRDALSVFQSLGDDKGAADALFCAASVYLGNGVCEEALSSCRDARRLYQEVKDTTLEVTALQLMARLLPSLIEREVDNSRTPSEKLLEEATQTTMDLHDHLLLQGDVRGQLAALTQLARLLLLGGDVLGAVQIATECYQLATELNDAQELASALLVMAEAHRVAGDTEAAKYEVGEATTLFEQLGEESGLKAATQLRDALESPARTGPAAFPMRPDQPPSPEGVHEAASPPRRQSTEQPTSSPLPAAVHSPRRSRPGYRARWTALMGSRKAGAAGDADQDHDQDQDQDQDEADAQGQGQRQRQRQRQVQGQEYEHEHAQQGQRGWRGRASGKGRGSCRYTIVGTWDVWKTHDMAWNAEAGCFEYSVRLGSSGCESFKILLEGDWDRTLYPDRQDASHHEEHSILGPDECLSGGEWTIGRHPDDAGCEGARYRISLLVSQSGQPITVSWMPLDQVDVSHSASAECSSQAAAADLQCPESLEDID